MGKVNQIFGKTLLRYIWGIGSILTAIVLHHFEQHLALLGLGIFVNIYLFFATYRSKPLGVFFLFALSYLIFVIPYYYSGTAISYHFSNILDEPEFYDRVLFYHVLFLTILASLIRPISDPKYLSEIMIPKKSPLIFLSCIFLIIIFTLFTKSGDSIFEAGVSARGGENAGGLALFEYTILFFLVAIKYRSGYYLNKYIIFFCAVIYSIKGLLYGGRIEMLILSYLIFVIFGDGPRIKFRHLAIPFSFGIYFLLLIGSIRNNPLVLLQNPDIVSILKLPFKASPYKSDVYSSNQGDVFYSSVRIVGLIEKGYISPYERFTALVNNFLFFVPSRFLTGIVSFASHMKKEFKAGGGGLISTYWWGFLGIPGVIIIAVFLSWIFNNMFISQNVYFQLYAVMVIITFPRWFAYNQISLFKICFFIIPVYFLFRNVNHLIFRKKLILSKYG